MARNKNLSELQKQAVRAQFEKLKTAKHKTLGTKLHSEQTIWALMEEKFFLTRRTMEDIVYLKKERKTGGIENQPGLFDILEEKHT